MNAATKKNQILQDILIPQMITFFFFEKSIELSKSAEGRNPWYTGLRPSNKLIPQMITNTLKHSNQFKREPNHFLNNIF